MNRSILTFCFFILASICTQTNLVAQDQNITVFTLETTPQDQEMSFAQLPEEVKMAYEESVYVQWEVKRVEKINYDPNNFIYRITISNGIEEFEIIVDQLGNIIG